MNHRPSIPCLLQAACSVALLGCRRPARSPDLLRNLIRSARPSPRERGGHRHGPRMEIPLRENPAATTVVGAETIDEDDDEVDRRRRSAEARPRREGRQPGRRRARASLHSRTGPPDGDGESAGSRCSSTASRSTTRPASRRTSSTSTGPRSSASRSSAGPPPPSGGAAAPAASSTSSRATGSSDQDPARRRGQRRLGRLLEGLRRDRRRPGPMNYRVSASRMMGNAYRDHTAYYATNLYGKFGLRRRALDAPDGDRRGDELLQRERRGAERRAGGREPADGQPRLSHVQRIPEDPPRDVGPHRPDGARGEPGARVRPLLPRHPVGGVGPLDGPAPPLRHPRRLRPVHDQPRDGPDQDTISAAGVDLDDQSIDDTRRPNLGGAEEGPTVVADQTIRQSGLGVYLLDRVDLGPQWGAVLGAPLGPDHEPARRQPEGRRRRPVRRRELRQGDRPGGRDLEPDREPRDSTRAGDRASFRPRPRSWPTTRRPSAASTRTSSRPRRTVGDRRARRPLDGPSRTTSPLFHLDTEHDFGRYRVPAGPLETFYGNLGATRRYGVETQLGWFPSAPLSVQLAYTYSNFKYTEVESLFGTYSDRSCPTRREHQLYLDLQVTPIPNLVLGLAVDASDPLVRRRVEPDVGGRLHPPQRQRGLPLERALAPGRGHPRGSQPDGKGVHRLHRARPGRELVPARPDAPALRRRTPLARTELKTRSLLCRGVKKPRRRAPPSPSLIPGWCRRRESNPHGPCGPGDFKSPASASFATPARGGSTDGGDGRIRTDE